VGGCLERRRVRQKVVTAVWRGEVQFARDSIGGSGGSAAVGVNAG
jgi:hypothetical protein